MDLLALNSLQENNSIQDCVQATNNAVPSSIHFITFTYTIRRNEMHGPENNKKAEGLMAQLSAW